ncbi:type II secretion system protein GspM [Dechloromonas sp. XY25]|uniref:Type II secretion system protein GspM n=1 Tax=Dechloromonas hankyongensis TaxID=2908002 RepID=A0ABS9K0S1_9RHOO|nr:type II secretion system protein GspM [Dechloromonas hankyongensis]MCG2576769.1 type II secretion system protein GspM [Dechloromonas hankyongensis]
MSLRQDWSRLNDRYQALSRRERLLVALAAVFGPLLIGYSLFVDPQSARLKAMENTLAGEGSTVARLQAEQASLQQQLSVDPDAGRKADLAALTAERGRLDEQLRQFSAVLVRPEEMNGLLESILARHAGLRLLGLKTVAPQSVLVREAKEGDGKPVERSFDLYRHGVEIRLEGSYGQLQAYLSQLEKLQQKLLWGPLKYQVIDYPRAELTLTVYTLSPDRTWLAL